MPHVRLVLALPLALTSVTSAWAHESVAAHSHPHGHSALMGIDALSAVIVIAPIAIVVLRAVCQGLLRLQRRRNGS